MAQQWSLRLAVVALFFLGFNHVSAVQVAYCSTLNTADTAGNYSMYQSNGLCSLFCLPSYAFAVLQGSECYCSNYVPATTVSGTDCNQQCSGYPDDLCGGDGTYGYIALNNAPSGTRGGSTVQSSTAAPSTSAAAPTTPTPTEATSTSTSKTTSSKSSSSSSSSSMTWTPTPVISLETVTGQVRTVTVTPTVPPNSASLGGASIKKADGGGLSTGGAVGLTIGLVALVAIVCSIIYFCIRKRKQEKEAEAAAFADTSRRGSSAGLGGPIPSRTMSENSRYILGTDGRQVVETWEPEATEIRRSRLMPVDPRLDPHAPLYQRGENKSRESINTIRDDHDYSRRVHQQGPILRATNPDE